MPKQSKLENGWTNMEGLEPGQNVCLKKELDELEKLLASFYDLTPKDSYQIIDTHPGSYTYEGKEFPRFLLRITGGNLRQKEKFCPSYLFTRA